jgi:haloalkane dehalogenase
VIEQNVFVEHILQAGVIGQLGEEEMTVCRRPFLQLESRETIYRFLNELPIALQPENVWKIAQDYMTWLLASEKPKLFFWASPGGVVWEAKAKELMGKLKNTRTVHLGAAVHYVQEDHPHTIGHGLANWLPLS